MSVPLSTIGTASTPTIKSYHLSPIKILDDIITGKPQMTTVERLREFASSPHERRRRGNKQRLTYGPDTVDAHLIADESGSASEASASADAHKSETNADRDESEANNDDSENPEPAINFDPHQTDDSFGLVNALADKSQNALNAEQLNINKARKTVQFRVPKRDQIDVRRKTETHLLTGSRSRKSRLTRKVSTRRNTRLSHPPSTEVISSHGVEPGVATIIGEENEAEATDGAADAAGDVATDAATEVAPDIAADVEKQLTNNNDNKADQKMAGDDFEFAKPAPKRRSDGKSFVTVRSRRTVRFQEPLSESRRSIENGESEQRKSGTRRTESRSSQIRKSENRSSQARKSENRSSEVRRSERVSRASRKLSTRRKSRLSNETIDEYVMQISDYFDCQSVSSTSYTTEEPSTSTMASTTASTNASTNTSSIINASNRETPAKTSPKRSTRHRSGFMANESINDLSLAPRRSEKICMKGGKWRRTLFDLRKIRSTTCKI